MTRALSQSVSQCVQWVNSCSVRNLSASFSYEPAISCFVTVNAQRQLVDKNIQLDCWFDSDVYWLLLWGSCLCVAVENLWAAFCDVNQLSSGTMSRNSLRSWKYWNIQGLIRADWSWRKSPTGFTAFGWKSDVFFFRITIRKRTTVHCHSHPMAKNNCVYNREWDLENFLIIQRQSMIQILAAG